MTSVILDRAKKVVEADEAVYAQGSRVSYFPLVVDRGFGSTIQDLDGNQYIDFLSSAGAQNTGHAHPGIIEAIRNQSEKIVQYTNAYMFHESVVTLSRKLIEITPGTFEKRVVFGLSGSDANDGVIKMARAHTGRSGIIAFKGSYHGSTYGAISLSAISLNMRKKIGPLLPDIHHFEYPNCYRCPFDQEYGRCRFPCLRQIEGAFEQYLPPEEVAAVFFEPVAGDAGLVVPPREFVRGLYDLCQKHGILFVSEEVQQGFGRTGRMFAIEHFDIIPDVVVMGKAIASGMPLSAVVARREIIESLKAPAHLFTMSGHPIALAAALATLKIIADEDLIQKSARMGEYIQRQFRRLAEKYPIIGEVRGLGLSIGVELVKDPLSKEKHTEAAAKICYRCWEKGLILIFLAGNVLRVQPPLVIRLDEVDRAMKIIEASFEDFMKGDIPDEILETTKGW